MFNRKYIFNPGPFSMAMLVYRSVIPFVGALKNFLDESLGDFLGLGGLVADRFLNILRPRTTKNPKKKMAKTLRGLCVSNMTENTQWSMFRKRSNGDLL